MPRLDLANDELLLLIEALEIAEYWGYGAHGDPELPVNNGYLWLPGDSQDDPDPYWPDPPTEDEQRAIDEVRAMRAVRDKLSAMIASDHATIHQDTNPSTLDDTTERR